MQDKNIQEFLSSLGYEDDAASVAHQTLIDAGLTRTGKVRIARNKLRRAESILRDALFRACPNQACQTATSDRSLTRGRPTVTVGREYCDVCGGSENARAVREMAQYMVDAGRTRLLVVGGTPNTEQELTKLLPSPCEVRFVLSDTNRTDKDAGQDANWADLIVIWASTPIGHKTSALYKPYKPLTVSRRSISALAGEVTLSLQGGR